jgi:DNA-binding LacI/PurR family transcriptional regulator
MTRPTLLSLAQELGVSRTTVSNAYSRPEKLSVELRERILAAAREAGYDGPSPLAASLRTGRTDTVGVLFTDDLGYAFSDPVSSLFLSGLAEQAQEAGLAMTVVSVPRGEPAGPMSKAMVDGLIVYSVDEDSPGIAVAHKRGIPIVTVDQAPEPGVPSVNIDDRAGGVSAVAHLVGLGHRSIGVIAVAAGTTRCERVPADATSRSYVVRERLAGWREAMANASLPPPLTVSCPSNSREYGRVGVRLLLEAAPATTAVVCLTDELAFGVLAELAALGRDVPQDLSVVGFDDSPAATLSQPALTTVRQPARAKGTLAAGLLIDQLATGQASDSQVLPTELVVRASTGPPRR